jgi:hypothetical protein
MGPAVMYAKPLVKTAKNGQGGYVSGITNLRARSVQVVFLGLQCIYQASTLKILQEPFGRPGFNGLSPCNLHKTRRIKANWKREYPLAFYSLPNTSQSQANPNL